LWVTTTIPEPSVSAAKRKKIMVSIVGLSSV
jgi:hypothetical protein